MATLGPRSYCYRSSCRGVELRLRVDPAAAWLVIRQPGVEPRCVDIPEAEVAAVVDQFTAIGEDPEKFATFVNAF
jgi:hypothetical protein